MSWNFSALRKKHKNNFFHKSQAGLGLVELLVSISIMVLVLSIIMTRQNSFDNAVLLRNQAFEIALQLREIQLSAVSASSDGNGQFRSVLGIHFDVTNGNEQVYKIFRDANGNGELDAGEEFGKQGVIDPRFEISLIAVDLVPEDTVSVMFERPNFDAKFFDATGTDYSAVNLAIYIRHIRTGEMRHVTVTSTGQIAVL